MTEPNDSPPTNRDAANWAGPVDRLSAAGVAGAKDDAVTGKRVSGPLQGFGQLWQKTFTVRLDGADISPTDLIALWKDRFPTFWPKGQRSTPRCPASRRARSRSSRSPRCRGRP